MKPSTALTLGIFISLVAGFLFAAGLALGGVFDPIRVQNALNLASLFGLKDAGEWDPTMVFVLGGAVTVSLVAFATPKLLDRPWVGNSFEPLEPQSIDSKIILGSALFGIGWAIAGYCPALAVGSVLVNSDVIGFVIAMLVGMYFANKISKI